MSPTNYTVFVDVKKLRNGFQYEVKQSNVLPGDRPHTMDKGIYVIEDHWQVQNNKKDNYACQIAARTPIDEAVEVAVKTLRDLSYDDEVHITLQVDVNPPKSAH